MAFHSAPIPNPRRLRGLREEAEWESLTRNFWGLDNVDLMLSHALSMLYPYPIHASSMPRPFTVHSPPIPHPFLVHSPPTPRPLPAHSPSTPPRPCPAYSPSILRP